MFSLTTASMYFIYALSTTYFCLVNNNDSTHCQLDWFAEVEKAELDIMVGGQKGIIKTPCQSMTNFETPPKSRFTTPPTFVLLGVDKP